ncbi:hypothetical protein VW35_02300 [Devosia soli]|uniref:Uncharacterized protein n=1 Tax=Devosia soli TaxID=361041 RepID=A0A0F5LFY5_9HYPH|nr:hypothetical protein VW35_02300 [Devosia soli]
MRNSGDASQNDGGGPANIADATEFNSSGAPVQTVADVDPSHPAVDSNPRAGTTVDQNRIDFNDPTKTGAEAVAENLREQGIEVADGKSTDSKSED